MAVPSPMAAYPDGVRPWARNIVAAHPDPAAIPGPVARRPNVIRARSNRHDFNLRRRRRCGSLDDGLRLHYHGRGRGWLSRHRNRSGGWSLPIRCRSGRRGGRLSRINGRRRVRLLDHIGRLSAIHGDVHDLALRAAGDDSSDTREAKARGQSPQIHKRKSSHMLPVGPDGGAGYSRKLTINLAGSCNRVGWLAVNGRRPVIRELRELTRISSPEKRNWR